MNLPFFYDKIPLRLVRRMKSKIFYGNYQYGVNKALFNEVKNNYDIFKKHIIIVPEKYTLSAETMLLDTLEKKATFKCEVFSINRLAMFLGLSQDVSKQEGILIVYRLIYENDDKLTFFKLNEGRLGFAEEIYESIMQFKSSLVSPNELSTKDTGLLKAKLNDIRVIYEAYEKYLNDNNLSDGSHKINALVREIKTNKYFDESAIYFVGFDSMTALNLSILHEFKLRRLPLFLGAVKCENTPNEHIYLNDVYEVYKNLLLDIDFDEVFVPDDLNPTFKHLLNTCFAYTPNSVNIGDEITLLQCSDSKAEVMRLKREIHTLQMQGVRLADINVLVSDMEKYSDLIKKNLTDIPCFFDTTARLDNSEIARFLLAILEGVLYGLDYDDWFKIVNNYYIGLDEEQILKLNNYIYTFRLNGIKWLKEFECLQFDRLNDVILRIKNCACAEDYIDVLKFIMIQFEMEEKTLSLVNLKEDLLVQKVLKKSYQVIVSMMDVLQKVCYGLKVSLSDFIRIFKNSLKQANVSLVPLSTDAVYIGDMSSYFSKKKVMIVLGASLGNLPSQKSDCGVLTDRELDNIDSRYKIEPKISDLNSLSRLKLLQNLVLCDKLIVMYPNLSGDNVSKPSSVMDSLSSCFVKGGECLCIINDDVEDLDLSPKALAESLDDMDGVLEYYLNDANTKYKSTLECFLNEKEVKLPKSVARVDTIKEECFFGKGYTSISEITEYFGCPYKHFLNRGLRLKVREPIELRSIDIGNILHKIAEVFCKYGGDKRGVLKKVLSSEEYSDVLKRTSPIVLKGLKNEAIRLMTAIENYMENSGFVPTYFEYAFQNKELTLSTKYGDMKVVGKVDRVDVSGDRFLIIDYKTSNKTLDGKGVYYGGKLQLPFYSYYYAKLFGKHPAGFAYFPIVDSFETDKKMNYRMNGVFINDADVLSRLDRKLSLTETNESKYFNINVKAYKNGKITFSSCVDDAVLNALCEYAYKACVKAVEEMKEGCIAVSPNIDDNVCDYCEFKGICKRDLAVKERGESSVSFAEICDNLKGGKNEL